MENTAIQVHMADLYPVIRDCVAQGRETVITVTGNSMRPFLHHNRDQVVLVAADALHLQPGDVPLYRRRDGQFVLHRIVAVDDGHTVTRLGSHIRETSPYTDGKIRYTMLGDAQTQTEPGIEPDQIVALAKAFYRRGRCHVCASASYLRYVRRWNRWIWLRPQLLWLHNFPYRVIQKLTGRCAG